VVREYARYALRTARGGVAHIGVALDIRAVGFGARPARNCCSADCMRGSARGPRQRAWQQLSPEIAPDQCRAARAPRFCCATRQIDWRWSTSACSCRDVAYSVGALRAGSSRVRPPLGERQPWHRPDRVAPVALRLDKLRVIDADADDGADDRGVICTTLPLRRHRRWMPVAQGMRQ